MLENRRSSMKTRLRPLIKQVQQLPQTLYNRLSHKPFPISNPQLLQTRAEALAWEPVLTLEQQEEDESWLNSEVQVCILSTPPEQDEPWVTSAPRTAVEHEVQHTLMHIFDESVDIGLRETLHLPSIKTDKHFVRAVSTTQPDALRRINATDPLLPSTRMTPNHEFAIVPRRTAPLPLNEHKMTVEQLINAAIVTFHLEQKRLPHRITIAAIRYWQYRISLHTYDPDTFYYDDMPIPITSAPIGDFGIDEVWLD